MLPKQMALHPSPDGRSELIFFAAPDLQIISEDLDNPKIVSAVLIDVDRPYVWAVYGEDFIFMNGVGDVKRRRPGSSTVVDMPLFPQAVTICVFAGRVFLGGAIIDGNFEPMGMRWPAAQGDYVFENDTSGTSGAELLLSNDSAVGDRIVALRPINFDYLAILCRKSIWIGRRTADPTRPADFSQRVTGKGCVNEATARLTYGGVIYLSDEGVELFDGNQSTHISYQLDDELVGEGMTPEFISQCSAAYNPVSQLYYLFTPLRTYVYDCLRQRWHRRSMIVLWGSIFAEQFHALLWSEAIGDWGDQGTTTWADTAPKEVDVPNMYFLGIDNGNTVLHVETAGASQMMGEDASFLYATPFGEFQKNIFLATHKALRVRYLGTGQIRLYLPDNNSEWEAAGDIPLSTATLARLKQFPGIHSGLGVGLQIEILSGDPRIESLELDYLQRGPRIESDYPFTPREYQADF